VCAFLFPLFLFSLLDIHPFIHPLDVFTLCAHVCFFFTFFNFASCLFSFMIGCFSSIRLHLPAAAAALQDSTTAPPVLLLAGFVCQKEVGEEVLIDLFSDGIFIFFPLRCVLGFVLNRIQNSSGSSPVLVAQLWVVCLFLFCLLSFCFVGSLFWFPKTSFVSVDLHMISASCFGNLKMEGGEEKERDKKPRDTDRHRDIDTERQRENGVEEGEEGML
jgi:hypothetical protein